MPHPHARFDSVTEPIHTRAVGGVRRHARPPSGAASCSKLPRAAYARTDLNFDAEPGVSGFHNSEASQAVVRYSIGQNGAVKDNFAVVLLAVWRTIYYESMKNIWDGMLSDHVMDCCDVWLQRGCQLNLPSKIDSRESHETSSKDSSSSDCDIDFPPGFGPTFNAKTEPSTACFSGPLAGAQMMLANEIYIQSKQLLFQYFEEVIAEEITNCLCFGLGNNNQAQTIIPIHATESPIVADVSMLDLVKSALEAETATDEAMRIQEMTTSRVINSHGDRTSHPTKITKAKKGKCINGQKAKTMVPCPESDGCARASVNGWEWHNWAQKATLSERTRVRGHRAQTILSASKYKNVWKNSGGPSARSNRVKLRNLLVAAEGCELLRTTQMKARKKQLRFQRSKIQGWGLVALESIDAQALVIEYVGELIRTRVSDMRESQYEKSGIGSSYLFRLDDEFVVQCHVIHDLMRYRRPATFEPVITSEFR